MGVVAAWAFAPSGMFAVVDCVAALGAFGLLAGMGRALNGERPDWTALAAHSFWMMTAKQPSLWACFLAWCVFSCAWLWLNRADALGAARRLFCLTAALGALFCVTGVSPYATSWRHFGHPFYPKYTVDEARFPVQDITADFKFGNADALAMGHLGNFVNAYVSRTLAGWYYTRKLGQAEFSPWRPTWEQSSAEPAPFGLKRRTALQLAFILALLFGKRTERLLTVMVALPLILVPTEMMGYLRYFPGTSFLSLIAFAALARLGAPQARRFGLTAATLSFAPAILLSFLWLTSLIETAYAVEKTLDTAPPGTVCARGVNGSPNAPARVKASGERTWTAFCNLRLLCRQEPRLRAAAIHDPKRCTAACDAYEAFFHNAEFAVPPGTLDQTVDCYTANTRNPSRAARWLNYPRVLAKVWLTHFPMLLSQRLRALASP